MRSVHSDRMGWGLSHERSNFAEAETLGTVEGNMCGIAMRDAVAPPGVEGHITSERNASEPERSHVRPQAAEPTGPHREGEKPKPMMHGHEKSDSVIVATKPPNKAGRTGRGGGGAKGGGQGEREPMPHVPDTVPGKRVTDAGARTEGREASRQTSEVGAVCRKAARTVVCPAKAGMFSRGQTCRGRSQSPVVWIAEEMETEPSKPIDEVFLGKATSHRAVTKVNALWPRK